MRNTKRACVHASKPRAIVKQRVAMLTNVLLHHNLVVISALDPLIAELRTFISAKKETERKVSVVWGNLDVVVQKSLRWTRHFKNIWGYRDVSYLHVPYDTLWQLWRYCPDVVVSGQFGARTLFATIYKMIRPKTRLIIWATLSLRTEATRGKSLTLLRKFILSRTDACFAHGPDGEAYLRSIGFTKTVFYTPYVIESGLFDAPSTVSCDGVTRLLYTGQLIERKGIYIFTVALCAWCKNNPARRVLLRIGGEGPERIRLESMDLPGNLQLEMLGHLDREAMRKIYTDTSVCVFPTLGDEWGMVVNESLSAGVPMLASEHAQASLVLIRHGSNGWIFNPIDPTSVMNNLDSALNTNRTRLEEMSVNARESVLYWTPEIIAVRMAEAIRDLSQATMQSR